MFYREEIKAAPEIVYLFILACFIYVTQIYCDKQNIINSGTILF